MPKGEIYHDPQFRYVDSFSGREVLRLNDYLRHSNHFYFTDPCWSNGNRSMVFCSDRENRTNLYRYDLDSGTITQITDLDGRQRLIGCVSEANHELYFWTETHLFAVDLETYVMRAIVEVDPAMPPSLIKSRAAPTADGTYIVAQLMEELPQEQASISYSYSRFREYYEKQPLSQIVRIEIASGKQEVIHEDRRYLGHVNPSPTLADMLTFCHEGPWNLVDQHIWGLDIQTGETWKMRPQEGDYSVGHEYWFADGVHIGYHGRPRDESGRHVFGHIRWDNEEWVEDHFPFHGQSWKMLSFACALSQPGRDADRGRWDAGVSVCLDALCRPRALRGRTFSSSADKRHRRGIGSGTWDQRSWPTTTEKPAGSWLFRARSTISTRTAAHGACVALYAGREGGTVYVGSDSVLEYVPG